MLLIRHCETNWGIEGRYQGNKDVPLNDVGRKNAHHLAAKIKKLASSNGFKILKIYSSCLSRSYETAKIISKYVGADFNYEKICEFNERNFGDWEGMTHCEIENLYGKKKMDEYLSDPLNFSIPNAESFENFEKRVLKGLKHVLNVFNGNMDADNTIIVVSHGGTNRIIICKSLNLSSKNFFRLKQNFGCVNIIEFHENFSVVISINSKI